MATSYQRYLIPIIAISVYLGISLAYAMNTAGLEEDEAMSFRRSATLAEGTYTPCRPGYEIKARSACIPLMIAPYVGTPKDYFLFPIFKLTGFHLTVARMGAALLAAFGIFGVWMLADLLFGPVSAAIAAGFLALNPSYIDFPVFDQGNIAFSLGVLGLILTALTLVVRRPSDSRFFALGVFAGLGVWARLNFAWLLIAGALAILVVFRLELLRLIRYLPALVAGVLVGAAPLLKFLVKHTRDVIAFMKASSVSESFSQKVQTFFFSARDLLLASAEHRSGIWHGAPIPHPLSTAMILIAGLALILCLVRGSKPAVTIGLTICILASMYLYSALPVSSHHLAILIPLFALAIGIALSDLVRIRFFGRLACALLCLGYACASASIAFRSIQDLHRTRGYGEWSASIDRLTSELEASKEAGPLYFLDWGFADPLLLLSSGRVQGVDLFWNPDNRIARDQLTWSHLIHQGGRFVTYSMTNLHFPEATIRFLAALDRSTNTYRKLDLQEKDGSPYASLFLVAPAKGPEETLSPETSEESTVFLASPVTLQVSDGTGLGRTVLMFWTKRSPFVEIHVLAPNGPMVGRYRSTLNNSSGLANVGKWVRDGYTFFLQDVANKPLTSANTLATVTVHVQNVK